METVMSHTAGGPLSGLKILEFGQIAVISLAWLATRWLRRVDLYRKLVAVPASVAIAGFGLWWTVHRIAG